MMDTIEMKIEGIYMDPKSNTPIVILRENNGNKILPIWIGPLEASSILLGLENINPPRPLTHDLFINFLKENNMKITKIVIDDLKNNTYYAKIYYKTLFKTKKIDARPSDALSLAIREKIPVFVKNKVLLNAISPNLTSKNDIDKNYYKEYLKNLDKDDIGNTIM